MLVIRDKFQSPAIYWLSPGAYNYHNAPKVIQEDCTINRPRLLTDCLMKWNRGLPRYLTLVRRDAFHASVVW